MGIKMSNYALRYKLGIYTNLCDAFVVAKKFGSLYEMLDYL